MDDTKKKVHPLKKLLAVILIAITAILSFYFINSCSRSVSSVKAEDLIGCTYYSKENNYIINFYDENTMNYVNSKKDEFLLLEYEAKENIIFASTIEETKLTFLVVNKSTILYEQLNKFLYLKE